MSEKQQFELKLAVKHHGALKTDQLTQFLQAQSNEFLSTDLPHSLTQDRFLTIFQSQVSGEIDYSEYVGLLLLYSTSSVQSFQYMKNAIPPDQVLNDLFLVIVQMDNTEKKSNAIGEQGLRLCEKHGYQFVRLTLYNSEDLVTLLHKNLYELIENYYYPNEEEKPPKKEFESQYQFQYASQQENQEPQPSTKSPKKPKPVKIVATQEEKKSLQKLLDKASELRESRNDYITQQQLQIDEAIENVEDVLNNLNKNIDERVRSRWFTSLKHTLYRPLQKNSTSFAKIKLTQQFLDESDEEGYEVMGLFNSLQSTKKKSGNTKKLGSEPAKPSRDAIINKFINNNRRKQGLMKLILVVADSVIVELDIFEDTNFSDLALVAMRKVGINETQHNYNLMKQILMERVEEYAKEVSKAVKYTEKTRIDERSFLDKKKQAPVDSLGNTNRSVRSNKNIGQYYSFR